jgi:MGT family glycosyltransferase
VTYFQMRDLEAKIRSEDIDFCAIGEDDFPLGSLPRWLSELGRLKGLEALRFTIGAVERTSVMVCRDAPQAISEAGVDALLVDQMEPAGGAVAEHLGLPFVSVCNALAINRDPVVPPPFTPWHYHDSRWAVLRNKVGYAVSEWMTRPVANAVDRYRRQWNLPRHGSSDEAFSTLAQICQMPREFDFPRWNVPDRFHYVGPLRRNRVASTPFPWEKLDGRPIVYASLGTLQNRREPLFRCFAEACRGLDVQLVISHGGGLGDEEAADLPGDPVVVSYAPQLEVLAHAQLTITHAGLNTVLDSLAESVPLVAIPIAYEQGAIARRVERSGAGISLPLNISHPDAQRLRRAVSEVLTQPSYKTAAQRVGRAIRDSGGVGRAADIVEQATSVRF